MQQNDLWPWPCHVAVPCCFQALLRGRSHQAAALETDAAGKPGVSVGSSGTTWDNMGQHGATKEDPKRMAEWNMDRYGQICVIQEISGNV